MITYIQLFSSVFAGGIGYLIVTFWLRPILRYKDLKHQLIADLIYYANAVAPDSRDELIVEHHNNRRLALRRHSAEFVACYLTLPSWYKGFLDLDKEEPMNAATQLMGLSSSRNHDQAAFRIRNVEKFLRIEIPGI